MTHNRWSMVAAAMISTREQLRSEISFRDEVIRASCLERRTEKLNDCILSWTVWPMYALAGSPSSQIVSALIHGINEWPKSREMPGIRECPRLGTKPTAPPEAR